MHYEPEAAILEIHRHRTREEIREIYQQPFLELIFEAQQVHRQHHRPGEVQLCKLLSIKTGGCPEDCAYCPQSAHYQTGVGRQDLMRTEDVLRAAQQAKQEGATRFCMGAAWRQVPEGKEFETVLDMVRLVDGLGLEVCCTLGMLTNKQALQLKQAGLTAYNHNLDTSPELYGSIITTRVYKERLRTIANVRHAGITVCCGGILGMGESEEDRIELLKQLSALDPHPESVPINMLVRAEGTPLANAADLDPLIMVRTIATARILMPASMVRIAAGRKHMSREAVTLCFLAGANSIFTGDRLLTTPNPGTDEDADLLRDLGLKAMSRG
jgi:biotin synthase